jgi:acyl-CoA reductase-like NAD-dependent aldehyde dehydrogenase
MISLYNDSGLVNAAPSKLLLELGGQNPAFVDATANIPDAAKKIVWGATAWSGQWCASPGYAYALRINCQGVS